MEGPWGLVESESPSYRVFKPCGCWDLKDIYHIPHKMVLCREHWDALMSALDVEDDD